MRFGKFDKVGKDKEIERKINEGDDEDIILEELGILLRSIELRKERSIKKIIKEIERMKRKLVRLRMKGRLRIVGIEGKKWKDRIKSMSVKNKKKGNLESIIKWLRKVGKKIRNLREDFKKMIRCKEEEIIVGENMELRNGEKRIMRIEIIRFKEKRIVGREKRKINIVRKLKSNGLKSEVIKRMEMKLEIEKIEEGLIKERKEREREVGKIRSEGKKDRKKR